MRALKKFVENEGAARDIDGSIPTLPLSGNLPDMHADTKSYIELQNIYRDQAARDCAAVSAHLQVSILPQMSINEYCQRSCSLGAL
jgi:hypothetical protein